MITLTYGSTILTLPNPDLGDVERYSFSNVFGTNRNGEVLNNPTAGQPSLTTLVWSITKMNATQRSGLLSFLFQSAGDQITVNDYNGDNITALISNTDIAIKTLRDDCKYAVTLELLVVS